MIQNIFWDWNGTLFDDVEAALAAVNDMLKMRGKSDITLDQYCSYIETPIIGFYDHVLDMQNENIADIFTQYHNGYERHLNVARVRTGAVDALQRLSDAGYKNYVLSASSKNEVEELLAHNGMLRLFNGVIAAENSRAEGKTGFAKEFFAKEGISNALVVGDTVHDIETAAALGADCIIITGGHQSRSEFGKMNVRIVDSIDEIEQYILSANI